MSVNPNFGVKLIPAPGHTLDGAIYYSKKNSVAFVGDTIFAGSYGRTDLPGGSEMDLMCTIKKRVLTLPLYADLTLEEVDVICDILRKM